MSDSRFGPLIDGDDVETALINFLGDYMPTYVPAIARIKDPEGERWPEGVAPIRSYTVVHQVNAKWPEDQLPMLLAYSPGLGERPRAQGDGTISGRFQVILTAISSGFDLADAKHLGRLYASAARLAIMQHESLGGFANEDGTVWLDSQNFQVTRGVTAERNLMAVSDTYLIGVDEMLNRDAGVLEPLENAENPPPDLPAVTETAVVVAPIGE